MHLLAIGRTDPVTFDEFFARLVRIVGVALGVWAIGTKRIEGPEAVAVILAFVGFEFVARFQGRKLKELERDEP